MNGRERPEGVTRGGAVGDFLLLMMTTLVIHGLDQTLVAV